MGVRHVDHHVARIIDVVELAVNTPTITPEARLCVATVTTTVASMTRVSLARSLAGVLSSLLNAVIRRIIVVCLSWLSGCSGCWVRTELI